MTVGINENVALVAASKNDKGSLEIVFQTGKPAVVDILAQFTEQKDRSTSRMLMFPFDAEQNGEKREVKRIAQDVSALRDILQHLLEGYFTTEEAVLDPYAGVDMTGSAEQIAGKLQTQSVLDRIYSNLVNGFIAKLNTRTAEQKDQKFRLLLVRRSQSSHYPAFRKMFINDNPFFEPMSVPATKLRFTKYEIEKGMNNGDSISKANADNVGDVPTETADAILDLGSR